MNSKFYIHPKAQEAADRQEKSNRPTRYYWRRFLGWYNHFNTDQKLQIMIGIIGVIAIMASVLIAIYLSK